MDSLQKESLGLVYLRVKDIADRENNKDVIYYFPKSKSNKKPSGFLINTKGAFITLCDLLPDVIGSQPLTYKIYMLLFLFLSRQIFNISNFLVLPSEPQTEKLI